MTEENPYDSPQTRPIVGQPVKRGIGIGGIIVMIVVAPVAAAIAFFLTCLGSVFVLDAAGVRGDSMIGAVLILSGIAAVTMVIAVIFGIVRIMKK